MTENISAGCGLLSFVATIIFAFSAIFTGGMISTPNTPTPIPTLTAGVASSPPLVLTLIPQDTDAYFLPANNQINYISTSTLGRPCYYAIAGRVFDLQGDPFTDFVVNIKMLDDLAPERSGYAFPGEGGYAEDGPSRWVTLLPQSPVEYEIWLSTEIGGDELSPHIIIPSQDCDHNMAIIDFVQVKNLP
jgi:hypothetical protein